MAKFYLNNKDVIELKGVVVREIRTKNKYQSDEPDCQVISIRPKGFLRSFARYDGFLDIKLPLEYKQAVNVDDIVQFTQVSVVPYSFNNSSFVAYSVRAADCKVIDHLDLDF